ncbi:MAG: hypothetical protein M1830_007271 [Pleopsidium flavum]|nr:MAG: hypothetical protein M1830_007271 [Pleopsidium flavum]
MQRFNPTLARTVLRLSGSSNRTITSSRTLQAWSGSGGENHVTNSKDELDIQSGASKSGKRDRTEDNEQSAAASERDSRKDGERAKKDMPEAPGPIIGMNDERGGKGH